MNNIPMEIDIHHTSRKDLIRKVRELENKLDEYNFTNMKLDKEIKELQEELTNQHDRFDDTTNSMKCCGNCDNEDIDYSDNNCMFSGKCKEVMISEVKDKYESYWKQKENL